MQVEIINKDFRLDLHGISGVAIDKDYVGTVFRLMDKMWQTIKEKQLNHKGINIWIYEPDEKVFAGVELLEVGNRDTELEQRTFILHKYAYYKHIGPYNLIKEAGKNMQDELKSKGFETSFPYVEIYGHWTSDETKLETELLMSLQ